ESRGTLRSPGPRSSVGQSKSLLMTRSQVRVLPGVLRILPGAPLHLRDDRDGYVSTYCVSHRTEIDPVQVVCSTCESAGAPLTSAPPLSNDPCTWMSRAGPPCPPVKTKKKMNWSLPATDITVGVVASVAPLLSSKRAA